MNLETRFCAKARGWVHAASHQVLCAQVGHGLRVKGVVGPEFVLAARRHVARFLRNRLQVLDLTRDL